MLEGSDSAPTSSQIVALARDASTSASYKPALLKALVRVIAAASTKRIVANEIPLTVIGSHFVRLYWVQTVVFRLRQSPSLVKEAKVVRAIRAASGIHRIRDLADLPQSARTSLDRQMATFLTINVLEAFHRSAPIAMPRLYTWSRGDASIRMTDAAIRFVVENVPTLEAIANLWWARHLEKVNLLAPLVIEKVERNGAYRTSLGRYVALLERSDGSRCFYCERSLSDDIPKQVDHVIPWSFLLADPIWDLVLACVHCNSSKSDTLPARAYIDKLAKIHASRAKMSFPLRFASPMLPLEDLERYYDAALSVEWPAGWVPTLIKSSF